MWQKIKGFKLIQCVKTHLSFSPAIMQTNTITKFAGCS